ncbi:MAG TPA: drug/metabolite exporter YedA [Blastocatellia bacterium]|nr:drug/metabolite exporter YedA [Blastocatellia bacterium]
MVDRIMQERPSRLKLVLAFAAVYIIWGSTYLAIRYAIETLPPLLMAGVRFILAGAALYTWARLRGVTHSGRINWRSAAIIGGLLLLGGNGAVVLAERSVPSGLAALLIATEPLIIVLLDWARPGGARPSGRVALGVMLGLVGMVVLIGPVGIAGDSQVRFAGAALLVVATLSWAAGSLYAARTKVADSPLMTAAAQMLAGGALLLLAGLVTGEAGRFDAGQMSLRSIAAFGYLIIFGSLVGFTSYSWLLKVTPPSLASTYAYVNPVVAVLLGWAFAGEPLTLRTMLAAAIIIAAVVIITSYRARGESGGGKALAETKGDERMADGFASRFRGRECAEAGD